MGSSSAESNTYAKLGASSSKAGVHQAIDAKEHSFFASVVEDVSGDKNYYSLLHADGAGTKVIVAYLAFKETGDPSWFRGIAQDSLVMNLDDIACVNAFESLVLSNTIGRNRSLIPDEVIAELIKGYQECATTLVEHGVNINLCGGETADLGDLVRTIVIDSTLFARVKKSEAISTDAIQSGDVIIGLSSTGQASYEEKENSGLGSNGYTLARHALIASKYAEKYPEIVDPSLSAKEIYQGKLDLLDPLPNLSLNLAEALLSPTRSYAPIIRETTLKLGNQVHGIIHCTGGGLSKNLRFGKNKCYIKDNLFTTPPIFELIQKSMNVPWKEMYTVFNMGHRIEIILPENSAQTVIDIAKSFGVDAQKVGYVEDSDGANEVMIQSEYGEFAYRL
ncbi:MAG: AIR synthase-related protein [Bdellovibrionota bacterium]